MSRHDFKASFFIMAVSIISLGYSLTLPQGVNKGGVLQAGVFPLLVSSGLLLCSLLLMIHSYKEMKLDKAKVKFSLSQLWEGLRNKTTILIVGIFLYFLLISFLGYLLATVLVSVIALYFLFGHKLMYSFVVSVSIGGITYVVFQYILDINLPKGFF